MSRYIRERYKGFQSYTPGEQPKEMEYIKLNTNESPFPPAPGVCRKLEEADMERLRLYPDPRGRRLKAMLADRFRVEPEIVFLANGSDDILYFALMAFNDDEDTLLFPDISYSFYEVIANLHGVNFRKVPLQEDMTIDYRDYCRDDCNVIIPNPNAPTGIALSLEVRHTWISERSLPYLLPRNTTIFSSLRHSPNPEALPEGDWDLPSEIRS